jgi:peptide/nickel transport system substrate-binding protein
LDANHVTESRLSDLPSGTVTFLFTDIQGSTRLERELRELYSDVLQEHGRLLREAFERYGGREVDTQGDSFFVVFPRARDAVAAAVDVQRALGDHEWPARGQVRVRIGMHTGEASVTDGRYVGLAVHRAARISAAGHGGQILLSSSTRDVVEDDLPAGQRLIDLGEQRLKDLPRPERVHQLVVEGLPHEFPPLKSAEEQELGEAAHAVLAPPWWRRRARVVVPLAVAAAVAAVAAVVLLVSRGPEAGAAGVRANALGLIGADGNSIDAEIPVDAAPTGVARGEGAIWVTNANAGTVSRIDPVTRTVRQTITVGSGPSGIAVGAGAVWVANYGDATVSRIDPQTNTVVGEAIPVGNGPTAVAFGEGVLWVANAVDRTLSRIDPISGRVRTINIDAVGRGIAVGGGSVWVTDESSQRVVRFDPTTNSVAETVSVGNGPTGIAFGERAVWVANSLDGTVSRIDAARRTVTGLVTVGAGPAGVTVDRGSVWVTAEFGQRVARIETREGEPRIVDTTAIGNRPKGVVATGDGVWVAVQASGEGHRGGRLTAVVQALFSIDPSDGPNLPAPLLHDGLTGYRWTGGGEGTQLVPNLAASIPDGRDGGRSYTFRLRSGIQYSDGTPLRPEDFRRALERAYELGGDLVQQSLALSAVAGTDSCSRGRRCNLSRGIVTTSDTVTFRLSRPAPLFLFHLSLLYPIPRGTPAREIAKKPVPGTGPYAIESYAPKRQLKLVRNRFFRVWSQAARPDGYPDEIVFRLGQPEEKNVAAVEQGKADVALDLLGDRVERLQVRYPRQLHVAPTRATISLFLDTKQQPFTDVRVRRALNYAIDRRRLVELGGGPALRQPTCQVIPPRITGYVRYCPYTVDPRPTGEWTAPDLARARQLIAASGTRGQRVTFWTWPEFEKEARYVVSLLRRLGYRAQLRRGGKDFEVYFRTIFDPKTRPQSGIIGWFGMQVGSEALDTLRCGFFGNTARFCDRRLDDEVARGLDLFASDQEAAARVWARLDRELVDQAPWVPLFTPRAASLASERVGNWQEHPFLGVLLDQLWVR